MSNDKTTLADVQPGGKVRLATVRFDRAHDLLGDAYNAGTHGIGYSQQAMELHDAIIPAQRSPATCKVSLQVQPSLDGQGNAWAIKLARESAFAHSNEHAYLPQTREETNSWQPHEWVVAAIQAAFLGPQPAQPSPGGQGDAPSIDYEDLLDQAKDLIHCGCSVNGAFEWLLEQLTDGEPLAARQPVGEPITVEAVAEIFNHPEYGLSINWLLENGIGELQVGDVLMVSNRAITDEDGSGEVYTAPPAQAVDLAPLVSELSEADREYAEAKKKYHTVSAKMSAAGGRASCRAAYDREVTAKTRLDAAVRALIDSQAVQS